LVGKTGKNRGFRPKRIVSVFFSESDFWYNDFWRVHQSEEAHAVSGRVVLFYITDKWG
jgi:hypothetical protein